MQKLLATLKLQDKSGQEVALKNLLEKDNKTALVIVFNRNQATKHLVKVWSAKLEKISNKSFKIYKILAFKNSFDDIFKHQFDTAVKSFFECEKDECAFAVYGNCAKRLYSAAKLKNDDMVTVAIFGEDKSLLFLHTEPFSDAAVKKLEAVI